MDWNSQLPLTIPQVLAVADTIPSRLFLWRNKMNEEIMNEIQPVRPKDQFPFSCRQCGACCRNIEGCVMVESLDAYRLARYLRTKGELIEGIEDPGSLMSSKIKCGCSALIRSITSEKSSGAAVS